MQSINLLAIDLAKQVFQLHGVDETGRCVLKKQLRRTELVEFMAKLPICVVAMEACGGSFFWARKFRDFGHEVRLISPQFVKPFVRSNKNDRADAEGIATAARQPGIPLVPIKEIWQQEIQAVHRARELVVHNKVALQNAILGLLYEFGILLPRGKGTAKVLALLGEVLAPERTDLTTLAKETFTRLRDELQTMHRLVLDYDLALERIAKSREDCQRISAVEGIGVMTATAVVAHLNPRVFKNGRHYAASLGLVPRQHSSGGKEVLLGISKRGDGYLRSLFIHGARAAIRYAPKRNTRRSRWVLEKVKTRGMNKACVALANRNARVLWALLARGEEYRPAI
jgi:transposase